MREINELSEIIDNQQVYERFAVEGDLLIAIGTVVINNYTLYLWGAIRDIDYIVIFLRNYGLKIGAIIDADENKEGQYISDVKVISPETFSQIDDSAFVFVLTTFCSGMSVNAFNHYFMKRRCDFYHFTGEDITTILGSTHDWIDRERREYYRMHKKDILSFTEKLDEESRLTICAYIDSYVNKRVYDGLSIESRYKYFYGYNKQEIYKHLDNEIWINCGASIGDTIYAYYMNGLTGSVYAIEADHKKYLKLEENIKFLPSKIKEKIKCYQMFIDGNTNLKSVINEKKITFINADIEGAELELLKSMRDIIVQDRPVISICIYHLKEDLVDIPSWLKENLNDYKYCVRKYTSWVHNTMQNFELVLYAIPIERYILK